MVFAPVVVKKAVRGVPFHPGMICHVLAETFTGVELRVSENTVKIHLESRRVVNGDGR
jgi:hypothetical protein